VLLFNKITYSGIPFLCQHTDALHIFVNTTQEGITTFVCVFWSCYYPKYRQRQGSALIKAKKTDTRSSPVLRYDYKAFSSELGKRVKLLRKERGLTFRALVVKHDFHLTQIQRIESGDGISVPTLLRLAETFQIPIETLVAGLGMVEAVEPPSQSSKK
jgi:hypothetical protein